MSFYINACDCNSGAILSSTLAAVRCKALQCVHCLDMHSIRLAQSCRVRRCLNTQLSVMCCNALACTFS